MILNVKIRFEWREKFIFNNSYVLGKACIPSTSVMKFMRVYAYTLGRLTIELEINYHS
jgi:hypothetical protein